MAADLIYAFRVMRLALLDADGADIGKVEDIVLLPPSADDAPQVVGFVVASQRRRIFVNAARVTNIDNSGLHLRSSAIDLNPFKSRPGEILVGRDVLDTKVGNEVVSDIALRQEEGRQSAWEVAAVRLSGVPTGIRRRRTARVVEWSEVRAVFGDDPMATEVAELRDLHPAEVAARVRSMPLHHRKQLAEVMDDERLADLLEELPETEQLRIIEGLDLDRLVDVLEEMEYDDAADLLAEMPGEQRTRVLDSMDPDEADVMRRLLAYDEGTAGGLMNPDAIYLGPTATVAEALAHLRDPEWPTAIAAQVFVCQPPFVTPTGRYLGVVHFQRLLREPPSMEVGRCLSDEPSVPATMPDTEVAERLAVYNLLGLAVTDDDRRILGVITVDDVLDRTLPTGWRQRQRHTGRPT
jgi:CBS domain-containing protein/sporulation protein YlmC with PRC-barrel domain